jgi:hypothetical protein
MTSIRTCTPKTFALELKAGRNKRAFTSIRAARASGGQWGQVEGTQARLRQPLADPELGCCVTDPRATGPGLAHTSKTRMWTIECKTLY